MESVYNPKKFEGEIYQFWEKNRLFEADEKNLKKGKKPFSIILPPPNANANLHLGHAMYVYEDIMIRFQKLQGKEVLWLPGADHAGFETQFVFEKHLQKEGKSRFDFSSKKLFEMIWDFVMKNRGNMENQLKKLGFALDWSKKKFTMDKDIIQIVYQTFEKLYKKGLVYHKQAVVNYCVHCGTSFSDLEIVYKERETKLWDILYPFDLNDLKKGGIVVSTTRPETMLGDEAVAVSPSDKRYKKLVGLSVFLPIINKKIKVIADKLVDPKFGTGAVKVTPAHDLADWEISQRHGLKINQVINEKGEMTGEIPSEFQGKKVIEAREMIIRLLKEKKLLIKEKDYKHRVLTCYKCGRIIELLPKKQWFVKIKPLAKKAKEFVLKEKIKIYPKRFKKNLIWWLENFHDWNISRQIVWGIRIPAYQCQKKDKWFVSAEKPKKCLVCGKCQFKQTDDTFDTWFSSAQWPFATLLTQKSKDIFNYFYPTEVMETGYDILPWWVARMIMIGIFATKKEPFKNVYLHGLVRDKKGQKMSKSKGNVVDPMEIVEKYGADVLRLSLVFETKIGADINFSEDRLIGMRNFVNKVWNIGRFIFLNQKEKQKMAKSQKLELVESLKKEFNKEKKDYLKLMKDYRFSSSLMIVYQFLWHRLADFYIEQMKKLQDNDKIIFFEELKNVYLKNLKMLHPFAPFLTEAIWQIFFGKEKTIVKEKID